jgi:hypothetical protein
LEAALDYGGGDTAQGFLFGIACGGDFGVAGVEADHFAVEVASQVRPKAFGEGFVGGAEH